MLRKTRPAAIAAIGMLLTLAPLMAQSEAPKHEIGLTLGGILPVTREGPGVRLELFSGMALQANYAYRLTSGRKAALYADFNFLANPLREVDSTTRSLTRDVATIYATPGIRVKFFPQGRISPYGIIGGGYALYEQSTLRLDGLPNQNARFRNTGVFTYGGGLDFKLWRFIGLRTEVRDFYSGSPGYNTSLISGGQHNVVVSGGIVVRLK